MFRYPLVFLMAHGSAQRTLEEVVPLWQRQLHGIRGGQLIIASPKDNPVKQFNGDHRYAPPVFVRAGLQQHWGTIAHARMKEYCNLVQDRIVSRGIDCVWLTEYDSLVLGDRLPFSDTEEECVRGFRVENWDEKNQRMIEPDFEARCYLHWPMWFSRQAFLDFNREFQKLAWDAERGLADRTTAAAIQRAGLKIIPTNPIAYTRNFISSDAVLELLKAIDSGARLIHGFKIEKRKGLT